MSNEVLRIRFWYSWNKEACILLYRNHKSLRLYKKQKQTSQGGNHPATPNFVILPRPYPTLFFFVKGVLHPDTKISMFCLFSPSSRKKSILLCMVVIDVCDSKSKSMIFFPWIYESLMWNGSKYFFPFQP